MRLSSFIYDNMDHILKEWDEFAVTVPAAYGMNQEQLRDHAQEVLVAIAADMETSRTSQERHDRSRGNFLHSDGKNAAEIHSVTRLLSGFSIDQMVSEYRALRASVLRLWLNRVKHEVRFEVEDMMRFNEAIDQAIADSVAKYSNAERSARHLFLAILGHDLRTPLGAASMGADFLLHADTLEPVFVKVASRISNSIDRANEIVENLLDFTRSQLNAGIPVKRAPLDLGVLTENLVDELRAYHPERTLGFERTGDLQGLFDGGRISQAFSNLVGNAIQHGYQDTVVSVKLEASGNDVVFSVHNQGEPISKERFTTIFNPLVQYSGEEQATRSRRSSLGLGLYITQEIVKAHGGHITIASDENGTTFTVHLSKQ